MGRVFNKRPHALGLPRVIVGAGVDASSKPPLGVDESNEIPPGESELPDEVIETHRTHPVVAKWVELGYLELPPAPAPKAKRQG